MKQTTTRENEMQAQTLKQMSGIDVMFADDASDTIATIDGQRALGQSGFWLVGTDRDHSDVFFGADDLTGRGAKFIGADNAAFIAWAQANL